MFWKYDLNYHTILLALLLIQEAFFPISTHYRVGLRKYG